MKSYLIELEKETDNTLRILDRIPNDQLGYRPHPKSMTLGKLAAHVVELHNWISQAITLDVFDFHLHYKPLVFTTIEDLKKITTDGYAKNKETITQLTEEDWTKEWVFRAGDHEIARLPKAGAMRFIVTNHLIHHRGQLSVYLRLLDIPVPGLYGPSADER